MPSDLPTGKNNWLSDEFSIPSFCYVIRNWRLLGRDVHLAIIDALHEVRSGLTVDGATDGVAGAEDLLNGPRQLFGHGPLAHGAGNGNDVIEGDVAIVDDCVVREAIVRRVGEMC